MKIQINVKDILFSTLERISKNNGLSPEKYASNIVQTFLESQYRGNFFDEIKLSSVEEIEEIKNKLKNKVK